MAVKKRKRNSSHSCTKRRRISGWSDLQTDLLHLILKKLSFTNILSFKAVCSSWRSVAHAYISSPSYSRSHPPWLILPTHQEDGNGTCSFFSLEEKRVYKAKNLYEELRDNCCVGSSHGWLLLLNQRGNLFLLNPLSGARVDQLPSIKTFPCVLSSWDDSDGFHVVYDPDNSVPSASRFLLSREQLQQDHFIGKAVLLSDPAFSKNNSGVVVMYGCRSKLAFCRFGDSTWTKLEGMHRAYCDIICHNDQLYALADNGSIEVWDFNNPCTIIKRDIVASLPQKMVEVGCSLGDVCSSQCYLVKSSEDFLLVVRYIGEFVDEKGQAVYEEDLLSDEDNHPLVCPYKTLMFQVYKLDFNHKNWVEVESLGDSVLFLGGSHSMSLSAQDFPDCEENSIYFTDDNWVRMNEDYLYGGHDLGVFNLKDGNVKQFCQHESGRIEPPPFWVVPNPW